MIYEIQSNIVMENQWATIAIANTDARVQYITDLQTGKNIVGDPVAFFALVAKDKQTEILPERVSLTADVLTVETSLGSFSVKVATEKDWFTFELLTALPEGAYKARMGHAVYEYDLQDPAACRAVGVALTYWTNPCFYPDGKAKETMAEVVAHLKDEGAKYGLIIAPHRYHLPFLKSIVSAADKNSCIVNPHGGPWGRESALNMGNSIIVLDSSREYLMSRMAFFKKLGADQVDFHKGLHTFCQGDFSYANYRDDADFKADVSDVLEENGITAGLHTYSSYVDYDCSGILSDPKWQKDLGVLETFTLSEDISANAVFLKTVESSDQVSENYNFFFRNTPFVLVGEEIIEFEKAPNGFYVKRRGVAGTKAVSHKAGEKISHLDGYYYGFAPVLGSELFYQIARNTAKTFCAGGFKTIYLDALDGIRQHCDPDEEAWFYMAAFVHEIMVHCAYPPMVEYSTMLPSLWLGRGRFGAWDTISLGFKAWNQLHAQKNQMYLDRYGTATMGWYNFYPRDDRFPGNVHTKYHHTDAVHHMGSLSLIHDFNVVFNEIVMEDLEKFPALARNIEIYKQYDKLRKSRYFSGELLEKIKNGKYEYHLTQTDNGTWALQEKEYQMRKLYDLADRGTAVYQNPLGEQTPFVRIEALLSSDQEQPQVILPVNRDCVPQSQVMTQNFDEELDLSEKLATCVRIYGNGKQGSAVAIELVCKSEVETSVLLYTIDTDYTGWRDFVLIEADNGQRTDLPFEDRLIHGDDQQMALYEIYRAKFEHGRVCQISVSSTDEADGVRLTDITACKHTFVSLQEPTIRVGDTSVTFHCTLRSTDYIEFDGKSAKMIDRYGNETTISYSGKLIVPSGDFTAKICAKNAENELLRAQLTLGFAGQIVN